MTHKSTTIKRETPELSFKKIFVYVALYAVTTTITVATFILVPSPHNNFPFLRSFIVFFASIMLGKYFFYMILSPWHDVVTAYRYKKLRKQIALYNPRVSVIIPAWNEEVGILSTMRSLLESTYKNLEIVVVNDGSTDRSDFIIKNFIYEYEKTVAFEESKIQIVYHYKENGGKGRALNTGILLSSGDIIMSIDADCIVAPQTVGNFVKAFADKKVMAAVGNVRIGNTNTIVGVIQYLEFLFSFYFKKTDSVLNTIYIIGGAAGAFRREVFDKVGMYNPRNITEDIELSVRIQDAGMRIVYADDAIVYTEGATTIEGLKKQRLRWKRGRFETFAGYKHLFFSLRQRHNKLLTYITLPMAVLGDIQLFLEVFFLIFLYFYSFLVRDFSSFISGIIVVGFMFFVQMFFERSGDHRASFYLLAPIGWLLFYLTTYIEYQALIKGVWGYFKKQDLKWQSWQRKGVMDS